MAIRQRKTGTFELKVTHRRLPKPFYSTHDTREQAEEYQVKLRAALDRGDTPPELVTELPVRRTPVSQLLRQYLNAAPIAPSDRPMVEWLQENVRVDVDGITVRWCDDWVRDMKRIEHLAPGTIRKRVESLARAVDWWMRREHEADQMPANPLRMLPRGYSTYGADDAPDGEEARVDIARDRRLHTGEAERIEAALAGHKREDRQRPLDLDHGAALMLLWRLIVSTGMRLREAYRLRVRDLRFDLLTIHVSRSKMTRKKASGARDIPMTRQVHDWLQAWSMPADPGALVFPFWNGDEAHLERTTNRLSQQFRRIFDYAQCEDLTEHDLRHEATCRWMLMKDAEGRWMFRPEEVRRITGHKSVQQFEKYLSLRGSDLAERLW